MTDFEDETTQRFLRPEFEDEEPTVRARPLRTPDDLEPLVSRQRTRSRELAILEGIP